LQLAIVAITLLAIGCGSANKGKIEGTKWIRSGQRIGALEFGKDGSLKYTVGATTYTGTYQLGGGRKVTFKLDQELEGKKEHVQDISIGEEEVADEGGQKEKRLILWLGQDQYEVKK